ncbi:response regulator transcription factor [Streptosporangium sp. NPDC000396]|uniref:response regulator transcription factor n=1 Tax=Streptosporangium sp. NPDC000396 TaxID=3366185 RepID=UPI0036AA718C
MIRILLAEDVHMVRGALVALLNLEPDIEVVAAIRRIMAGERVIDPKLAVAALDMAISPLSERELDVLRRFSNGDDLEQIAAQPYLSVGTVRNYLTKIVTKLYARNRLHAVHIAKDAGWL